MLGRDKIWISQYAGTDETINFYRIETGVLLRRSPGYGHAGVLLGYQQEWKKIIDEYLEKWETLEFSR